MKRFRSILIVLLLFVLIFPAHIFAASETDGQLLTVEQAIKIAKDLFPLTQDLDQFDSTFEQNEYDNIWSLRWYKEQGGGGELNVRVNAASGEIAGFSYYHPNDYSGKFSNIPKVSRQEGEKIALDFIKKVAPSKSGEIVLKPNEGSYYGGPVFHYYNFVRTIKGIEYPLNNISVEVNGQTGDVRSFYVNWESIDIPAQTAKLSSLDAGKIFTEKQGFELKYFKPRSKPIKVIYEINNPYQVAIDALTGEIIADNYYYGPYYDGKGMGGMAENSGATPSLEPYEQQEADQLKGLISRERAFEIATKVLTIPENYKLNYSTLNKDWDFPELRIWSFQWSLEAKDRYGWASIEIDAKTGKVLAFDRNEEQYPYGSNQGDQKSFKVKTKADAEKIVQDYLKTNYPEVVGNLRLQTENYMRPLGAEGEKNQPSYYFYFERLVNEIPFTQNLVYAQVNSYTGEINSFRVRFLDLEFPAVDNVLDKGTFTAEHMAQNPMNLVYSKDQDNNLRLVYKLAPLDSYRYDAITGQMLDYNGEPLQARKAGEITDIKGHWAENEINILNQMSLLHYENGLFQPDTPMTQAELIKALVKASYSYISDAPSGNWYDNYYQQAKQLELITEEEINPEASLTREEVAKFITRTIVGDKIARLSIYQIPFQDKSSISQGYLGYIAIVDGLGIMKGQGTVFQPQREMKKGEVCVALVRYLKLEK
ncbi:MAG: S-layer homology domain-containing protein [Dehalobacterium sp.]